MVFLLWYVREIGSCLRCSPGGLTKLQGSLVAPLVKDSRDKTATCFFLFYLKETKRKKHIINISSTFELDFVSSVWDFKTLLKFEQEALCRWRKVIPWKMIIDMLTFLVVLNTYLTVIAITLIIDRVNGPGWQPSHSLFSFLKKKKKKVDLFSKLLPNNFFHFFFTKNSKLIFTLYHINYFLLLLK